MLSFHATKVFNTFEGGAIVCHDAATKQRIDYLKNFGFAGETRVVAPGINAKMNEVEAAFGLLQLKHVDAALSERASIYQRYTELLADIEDIDLIQVPENVSWNYAYFPILIKETFPLSRDEVYELLKTENIYTRRYFFPLISSFAMYRGLPTSSPENLPYANKIADEVLCLPIYPGLSVQDQLRIVETIKRAVTLRSHSNDAEFVPERCTG